MERKKNFLKIFKKKKSRAKYKHYCIYFRFLKLR